VAATYPLEIIATVEDTLDYNDGATYTYTTTITFITATVDAPAPLGMDSIVFFTVNDPA